MSTEQKIFAAQIDAGNQVKQLEATLEN